MSPVRMILTVAITSFSVAALMGIVALFGGDFGETEARVLLTTLVVGCASMAVLCFLSTAGSRWAWVGVLGGVVAALPTVIALVLIWGDWDDVPVSLLRTFFVGLVAALTLAQVSLLLSLAHRAVPWLLWSTVAVAVVLAGVVSGQILAEDSSDGVLRLTGVLGILDVLGTVVVIGLALFGRPRADAPATVVLPAALAAAIGARAAAAGRTREDLVAEAVARYLAGPSAE
jgi:hypothetical protein